MGDLLSTPSDENENPSQSTDPTIPSSKSSELEYSFALKTYTLPSKSEEKEESIKPPENTNDVEEIEEEEEEGECGFCVFMKGGACKDVFTDWEKCVAEGEKNKEDIIEKCQFATTALRECLEANPDYYGPVLAAEAEDENESETQKEGSGSVSESEVTIEVENGENFGGDEKNQS